MRGWLKMFLDFLHNQLTRGHIDLPRWFQFVVTAKLIIRKLCPCELDRVSISRPAVPMHVRIRWVVPIRKIHQT